MPDHEYGTLLFGAHDDMRAAYDKWQAQPLNLSVSSADAGDSVEPYERTLAKPVEVTGPGTFVGKSTRTVVLEPGESEWWLDRKDLPELLPTRACLHNVWTTGSVVSNIVLRSGPPENYIRMVEHMIALRLGLGIDNMTLRFESGDPPLFEDGSVTLIDAIENAGIVTSDKPANYFTVKEPVAGVDSNGSFIILNPASRQQGLWMDCAVDFSNIIGQQRIQFPVTPKLFTHGACARTNTTANKRFYCRTIGKIFADIRNLGYSDQNVLVAGKERYINEPRLYHDGKSLEVVWHRAVLDLLAAIALLDGGRFVGEVTSYKAGHRLDIRMMTQLLLNDLLQPA